MRVLALYATSAYFGEHVAVNVSSVTDVSLKMQGDVHGSGSITSNLYDDSNVLARESTSCTSAHQSQQYHRNPFWVTSTHYYGTTPTFTKHGFNKDICNIPTPSQLSTPGLGVGIGLRLPSSPIRCTPHPCCLHGTAQGLLPACHGVEVGVQKRNCIVRHGPKESSNAMHPLHGNAPPTWCKYGSNEAMTRE